MKYRVIERRTTTDGMFWKKEFVPQFKFLFWWCNYYVSSPNSPLETRREIAFVNLDLARNFITKKKVLYSITVHSVEGRTNDH